MKNDGLNPEFMSLLREFSHELGSVVRRARRSLYIFYIIGISLFLVTYAGVFAFHFNQRINGLLGEIEVIIFVFLFYMISFIGTSSVYFDYRQTISEVKRLKFICQRIMRRMSNFVEHSNIDKESAFPILIVIAEADYRLSEADSLIERRLFPFMRRREMPNVE
jgi:hypothetical protein